MEEPPMLLCERMQTCQWPDVENLARQRRMIEGPSWARLVCREISVNQTMKGERKFVSDAGLERFCLAVAEGAVDLNYICIYDGLTLILATVNSPVRSSNFQLPH